MSSTPAVITPAAAVEKGSGKTAQPTTQNILGEEDDEDKQSSEVLRCIFPHI